MDYHIGLSSVLATAILYTLKNMHLEKRVISI